MSNYTPYYEGGWKNEEEMTTTPICAEALNHMEEGISAAYDTDIGLYPTETASGDVAVIHDGAESIPVRDLSVAIEPVQGGTGTPSPSNVRAINGWSAVKVARTRQNLLPNNYTETVFSRNGITFTVSDDGVVTANGTATAATYFNFSGWDDDNLPFMHRPGLRLRLSGSYPGVITRLQIRPYGSSTTTTIATDTGTGADFTVPDDVRAYALFINITSGQTVTNATFYPVISVADEGQPTWSPSEADVEDITLPTTVYGGTLDVTKGILIVDRASVTLDGSEDEEWIVMATAGIFRNRTITPAIASDAGLVSDKMTVTAYNYNTMKANYPAVSANTGYVYIAISDATTTATQCRAWLAENPVQLVYNLATPQTYTLTPVQVKTLLGENRIYADAGDVEVQYRVDFNAAGLMYVPKAPTADGSYRLTADVSGGTPTYRWEAAE